AALGKQFPNSRPVVAAFCALPGEPGGTDLPEALQEAGYEVVLPVVKHSPRRLEWRTFTGMADLVANSMGILEPTGENLGELVDTADVAILPALALGSDGTRLGQGGGFYDRTLAAFVPGDSTLPSENVEPSHVDATPTPPQTVDPATTLHVDQRFPAPRLQAIWAVVDHSELRVRVPAAPLLCPPPPPPDCGPRHNTARRPTLPCTSTAGNLGCRRPLRTASSRSRRPT